MAEPGEGPTLVLPAEAVLGRGRGAALGVLMLRVVRAASLTLVVAGIAVAVAVGQLESDVAQELTTLRGLERSMATPLVVLAVGVVLRFLVGPIALLLAVVAVGTTRVEVRPTQERRGRFARWWDHYRAVGGYKSLRWSVAVKHEAVDRLGAFGTVLAALEACLHVLTGFAVLALPVVIGLRG